MTTGGSVISSYLGNWDTKTEVMKFDGVENSLLKIRSESGKLFFFGCRFPPKSRNFGTLHDWHLTWLSQLKPNVKIKVNNRLFLKIELLATIHTADQNILRIYCILHKTSPSRNYFNLKLS